jgi:hypothetical protein
MVASNLTEVCNYISDENTTDADSCGEIFKRPCDGFLFKTVRTSVCGRDGTPLTMLLTHHTGGIKPLLVFVHTGCLWWKRAHDRLLR